MIQVEVIEYPGSGAVIGQTTYAATEQFHWVYEPEANGFSTHDGELVLLKDGTPIAGFAPGRWRQWKETDGLSDRLPVGD